LALVLVIDDEKTPSLLASHVRALGHSVLIARDGDTALMELFRTPFDVVFVGLRTAALDELALLREIRRRWPDVVVMATEYATVREAAEAIREQI
jgi:DNA-binding NtrC family response regulator